MKRELKGVRFLFFIILIYLILFIFDSENIIKALSKSLEVVKILLPIILFIILLNSLINFFLKPKQILKHFGKDSGKLGVFYTIIGGILSHGPTYAWYNMLGDLKKHGFKDSLIAMFLYTRAIKLPLIPLMITIFGVPYTILVNFNIIIFALIQAKIIDLYEDRICA